MFVSVLPLYTVTAPIDASMFAPPRSALPPISARRLSGDARVAGAPP